MFRGITLGVLVSFPLAVLAADPTIGITNLQADSCYNNGSGGACQVTADCVDTTSAVNARACSSDDTCRRTGVPCNAVQNCAVIDPDAACEEVDGQQECVLTNQVCAPTGQCFVDCADTSDCASAGDKYVCWKADPADARGLCYETDLVCRDNLCVFDGGVAGGEAGASPRSVPVDLSLSDDKSRKLELRFTAKWTLDDPAGLTCPSGFDEDCGDDRMYCNAGQCTIRPCADDTQCVGQSECEFGRCVIRGRSGFAVDYEFPDTCAAGAPCAANTAGYEIPSFMIEDSPNATISVDIVKACEPEPLNPPACTNCMADADCGLGRGCGPNGACLDLFSRDNARDEPCGPGFSNCAAGEACIDGICFQDNGFACGIGDGPSGCVPPGAPIQAYPMYACVRGSCVEKECYDDAMCVPNGIDPALSPNFACIRGACVDLTLSSACGLGQSCLNDKCLADDLCESFDDVTASIDFQLDRKAPLIDLSPNPAIVDNAVAALEACDDADIDEINLVANGWLVATDAQTQAPHMEDLAPTTDGCTVRRIVRAADECGNVQDVTFLSYKAPEANDLFLDVKGYACPSEGPCDTENAAPIANNQLVSRAVAQLDKGTPENPPFTQLGCDVVQRATLINNDRFNGTCPEQPPEPQPNGFCSNCEVNADCGLGSSCYNGTCIDLNKRQGVCGEPPNRACPAGSACVDGVCLENGNPQCATDDECAGAASVCLTGVCIDTNSDLPCNSGEICRNARCVETSPTCTSCMADAECPLGWGCLNSTCIDLNKGANACNADADCANGFACTNGVCLFGGQPQCTADAECAGANGACVRGVCIDTVTDSACPADQICQDNGCVPANGNAECATDDGCPGNQQCLQNRCYEPMRCSGDLDCIGSRFCDDNRCTSPCQVYVGEPIDRAGSWTVSASIEGCDGVPVTREWSVNILERPAPALDGPQFDGTDYRVTQGEVLVLDASATQSPVGIVEYAWDVNGRDGFEAGPGGNVCNRDDDCRGGLVDGDRVGETCEPMLAGADCAQDGSECYCRLLCADDSDCRQLPGSPQTCYDGICRTEVFPGTQAQYSFDTNSSGEYPVRLRVTDDMGASSTVRFNVLVSDVEPVCDLGENYVVDEGEELQFRTDGISEGHPDDPIVYYGWNFGDGPQGNTGREQTHVFDIVPGEEPPNDTYTVQLTLRDIDTPIDNPVICTVDVTVRDVNPTIEGIDILNPQNLVEGAVVQFDSRFRGNATDPIQRFSWTATCIDEDNNPCNALATPPAVLTNADDANGRSADPFLSLINLKFTEHGRYRVCLTVTDEDSDSEPFCEDISIADVSPRASIEGPTETDQGTEERFNLRGTMAGDPADPLREVSIDWRDGSQPQIIPRNGVVGCTLETLKDPARDCWVSHTYAEDGEKVIRVRANDQDSAAFVEHTITVNDAKPTAVISITCDTFPNCPEQFDEGKAITFSAANSLPGNELDPIAKYVWDFGDGTRVERAPGQVAVTHTYGDNGGYLVTLTVIDNDGSETSTTYELIVDNIAPKVVMVPPTGSVKVALGESIQFLAVGQGTQLPTDGQTRVVAIIDDVAGDTPPTGIVSAEWNVGENGEVRRGTSASYVYGSLGRKTVTFNIQDPDGASAGCVGPNGDATAENCQFTVEVTPAPPVLTGPREVEAVEGENVEFTVRVTAPPIGEGQFGELNVRTEGGLSGAVVNIGEQQVPDGNGAPYVDVDVQWTPNYYEAPIIKPFQVTAFANNTSRSHTVGIRIIDGGTPRLATLGGRANLGVLTFYDYGLDPSTQQLKLSPTAPIPLGLGVGRIAAGPEGRYLWATVPGSDRVAVVDTQPDGPGLVRRVPVGHTPTAIVVGGAELVDGARIWVANQGDNTISVIDPVSMKLDYHAEGNARTSFDLPGLDGPSDMVWLPAGFDGLEEPRLVVITRHSGHIAVIDPGKVVNGEFLRAVTKKHQIGAMLNRIVADPVSGDLFISDVKARQLYRVGASELDSMANPQIESISLVGAARDMVVNTFIDSASEAEISRTVIASDDGMYEVSSDDITPLNSFANALTTVNRQALAEGAIVLISSSGIIKHVRQDDLTVNIPRPSSLSTGDRQVQRMLMFISPR